jgi:DMSO reductase family type II enzyme heme b subunit
MKKVAFLTLALSASLLANTIAAIKIKDDVSKIAVDSGLWGDAISNVVTFYPQSTIRINDKTANKLNANRSATKVTIKALSDGANIAFKLIWKDSTKSLQKGIKTREYPDGFALQFPLNFSNLDRLPYIGMGSSKRPVIVYLNKAVTNHFEPNGNGDVRTQLNPSNNNVFNSAIDNSKEKFEIDVESKKIKTYERAFISEGFRSLTQIKDNSAKFSMKMEYQNNWFSPNEWEAVFIRPLNDEYAKLYTDTFPVSFAIWDGAKLNRDGLKLISPWTAVKMLNAKGSDKIEKLITVLNRKVDGNEIKGKELVDQNCASCHVYADQKIAPRYMAPNLSNIGGYSTTEYLRESITEPNAVVVPGYNRNAHPNYQWYYDDGQGGRTSAMPSFSYMSAQEIDDMVAYLKTLKSEVK